MNESQSSDARWLLLPLTAACLLYLPSLGAGFVYDDNGQILNNPWVHDLRYLPRLLTRPVWAFKTEVPTNYYRPVQMGLYNLLWSASGGNPLAFHAVNLLLHLLVITLLFFLIRRLSPGSNAAPGAALLFALHPLSTETVNWIACIPEMTYALFGLATLWLHAATWETAIARRRLLRFGAVALFLLATFSKETALTLLAIIPLMDWLLRPARPEDPERPSVAARCRRALGAVAPYALAAALYLSVRLAVVGGLAPLQRPRLTARDALLNAPGLLLQYLGMMIAPVRLLAYHVLEPVPSFGHPAFLLSLACVVVLLAGLVLLGRRAPVPAFAGALTLLPLLPVLYIPAVGESALAERYAYLPIAGFAWLVAGGVSALAGRVLPPARARAVYFATIGLLAALSAARCMVRNPVWHDDGSLATATLRDEPRAWHMYLVLGNWHEREDRLEEAMRAYSEGLKVFPDKPQLQAANINIRLKLHQISPEEAIREYLPLSNAYPAFYEVQYNLGDAYLKVGHPNEAEQAFRRARALNPFAAAAREGLNLALIAQGRTPEASGDDTESLLPAARSRALLIRAVSEIEAGRLADAAPLLEEALRLDPKSHRALLALAVLESKKGDDLAAMDACRRALALDPNLADVHEQMGVSAQRLGDLAEAIRELEKAAELDPRNKEALSRLGVIYAQAGRLEEAKKEFEKALALDPGFEAARRNLEHLQELQEGKDH